eukprot:8255341-Karenia_brevis.AAC.1
MRTAASRSTGQHRAVAAIAQMTSAVASAPAATVKMTSAAATQILKWLKTQTRSAAEIQKVSWKKSRMMSIV